MIRFLIKKTFYDFWNNLLNIIVLNVGFTIFILFSIYILTKINKEHSLLYIISSLSIMLLLVYDGIVSGYTQKMINYKKPGFTEFKKVLGAGLFSSLKFSCLVLFLLISFYIGFSTYIQIASLVGYSFLTLFLLTSLILAVSLQYFFPIYYHEKNSILYTIKKAVLIFLDNVGISITIFMGSVIIFILSFTPLFLFCGIGLIALWINNAFKFLMYKYSYLQNNPDQLNNVIPWNKLLDQDKVTIGKLSFKEMLFPWRS